LELPFAALVEAVDRRGAEVLGASLHGAPAAMIARAVAGVGTPLGRVVLDAASTVPAPRARAQARALVARTRPLVAELGAARAIGLHALAQELAREEAAEEMVARVAQRLPPGLGQALLALAWGPPQVVEGVG
jgi:hypothetical protein